MLYGLLSYKHGVKLHYQKFCTPGALSPITNKPYFREKYWKVLKYELHKTFNYFCRWCECIMITTKCMRPLQGKMHIWNKNKFVFGKLKRSHATDLMHFFTYSTWARECDHVSLVKAVTNTYPVMSVLEAFRIALYIT